MIVRQAPQNVDLVFIEAYFLARLTQGRRLRRDVFGVDLAARKRDLARMAGKLFGPLGQDQIGLPGTFHQADENGGGLGRLFHDQLAQVRIEQKITIRCGVP